MTKFKALATNIRERHKHWLGRCDWCSWPLAETVEEGCVETNCSMRPLQRRDDTDLRQDFRTLLRAIEERSEKGK